MKPLLLEAAACWTCTRAESVAGTEHTLVPVYYVHPTYLALHVYSSCTPYHTSGQVRLLLHSQTLGCPTTLCTRPLRLPMCQFHEHRARPLLDPLLSQHTYDTKKVLNKCLLVYISSNPPCYPAECSNRKEKSSLLGSLWPLGLDVSST